MISGRSHLGLREPVEESSRVCGGPCSDVSSDIRMVPGAIRVLDGATIHCEGADQRGVAAQVLQAGAHALGCPEAVRAPPREQL